MVMYISPNIAGDVVGVEEVRNINTGEPIEPYVWEVFDVYKGKIKRFKNFKMAVKFAETYHKKNYKIKEQLKKLMKI